MMYLLKKIFIIFAKINLYFFEKSTKKVSLTQQDLLKSILKSYSITDFGKDHNISAKMVYDEFSQTVPIQNYESLEKYIIKQKSGLKRSLTEKKVKVWEKTSGSSGKSKFIPYTSEIFKVFGKVIFLWVSDLLVNGPKFKTGKVFFSLSPQFSSEELSVDNHSLSDDSEYLPFWMRLFFSKYFVMPKGLKNLQDPKSFKLVLMSHLIATRDLETIFIWSPSYLISLLEFADENKIEIISIISQRKYKYKNYTYNFPDADIEFIKAKWGRWEELWPHLALLSCWTDGSAALFIPKLKKVFPNIFMQGKGLLATEGPMTVPMMKTVNPVPVFKDVFFEFIDDNNKVYRLHELSKGQEYKILITHISGIIRYDIGDVVKVTGFYNELPCLRFLGRAGNFSDMTGEKLNEQRVQSILSELLTDSEMAIVAPSREPKPHYICFYDGSNNTFIDQLEKKLMEVYHYEQSRKLGQLGTVKLIRLKDVESDFFDFYLNKGLILGDIKFVTLFKSPELTDEFLNFLRLRYS